jgi:hypothetical protein
LLRYRQYVSRPGVERGTLLCRPVVALVHARDAAAAAADVIEDAFGTSSRTPRRCNPVATVRGRSCSVHGTSGVAIVLDAAATFDRASVLALSSAAFAFDHPAKGVPRKPGSAMRSGRTLQRLLTRR